MHVFVGDDHSGRQVSDYNHRYGRDVKFIDMKTSDLRITKGDCGDRNWLLETNDRRELLTYLFNLPENRYNKAINHRGKYNLFINDQGGTKKYY